MDFSSEIDRRNSDSAKWRLYKDRDIIPLWVADMDFPVAPEITSALQARLDHGVFGYADATESVVEATLNHLKDDYGWTVEPEWLVWLPGVVPGLAMACRTCCDAGDSVLVSSPVYYPFLVVPDVAERTVCDVPLKREDNGHWHYDLDALEQAAADPRARMIILCSPHNPVGRVYSPEELAAVVEIAARHGLTVVSDEIHDGLVLDPGANFTPTAMAAPAHAERMITLMSPSKTFNLAGLNASYAVIPDEDTRTRFRHHMKGPVIRPSPFALVASEAAYRDGGAWHAKLIETLRANRDRLLAAVNALPGVHMDPMAATYLGWIDVSALRLNDAPSWFEDKGLGFSPGAPFGDDRFVRWNFGCPPATLERAIARFETAVGERARELGLG
ncbi:MAG: PatB family C-S lyase [Pseudomonadota bacterium]